MKKLDQDVTEFVADFTGINPDKIKLDSTLLGDLGVDGEDGWDIVKEFGSRFGVDLTNFQVERYFGPEGLSVLAPLVLIWRFVSWPFAKRRSVEEASGLIPIRVGDLVFMAEKKQWCL